MSKKKIVKIAIVNRSFWPIYPVIGEALMRFAESAEQQGHRVSVIMQDHSDIHSKLKETGRGKRVAFFPCKALTNSASGLILRAIDTIFFSFWVIAILIWVRPNRVYVSTDPPIMVPFIVMIYSRLFGAQYIYHLQDIHPEATKIVVSINDLVFKLLKKIDSMTMRYSKSLITITDVMAREIKSRSKTQAPIRILNNPAVEFSDIDITKTKKLGFTFCGNVGRLQRIPLVLKAIETYFQRGGKLKFEFAGGGVYADNLKSFSCKYSNFNYLGSVSPTEAAQVNANFSWALLPIEDEVTRFAFPSKSSTYVFSGANILAICGEQTGVAQWVRYNNLGIVIDPKVSSIVNTFFAIEKNTLKVSNFDKCRDHIKGEMSFEHFVKVLDDVVLR